MSPCPWSDHDWFYRTSGADVAKSGDLVNVHAGNAGKVRIFNAYDRIDVGFGLAIGCSDESNLTSSVPLNRSLGIEHLHHVAEHGRITEHLAEYVGRIVLRVGVVVAVGFKWVGEITRHIASIELFRKVYTALQVTVMSPM